jgi:hypothetical protein
MVHTTGVKHRRSTALVRAAIALAAMGALLQPATAAAAPDDSTPQGQYRKAHEAITAKNWEEARRLLLDLWSQSRTYDVGSSLVFVEYQLQHYARAATFAAYAIQNAPPIERPEEIDRLRKALEELKQRVGSVQVIVNRPGADVLVDGENVGTSPLSGELYLDVGPHQLEARLPGGVPVSARVDALAGEEYRVELNVPPSAGEAAIAASPTSPSSAIDSAPQPAEPKRNYTPAIVAASVGGVALIGGVVSLIVSENQRADARDALSDLSGLNPCGQGVDAERADRCDEIADQADGAETFRALGFVGLGTAIAAGAVTYVLWPSSKRERVGTTVVPAVSTSGNGFLATVSGAF